MKKKDPKAVLNGLKSAVSRQYNERIREASSKAQITALKAAKTRKMKQLEETHSV